ncbi:MAG: hypothetical protein K2M06_02730 [Muribaculaceae bacterium]|nr:hypothetical protein [Muribaculaceae bacterium]
MRRHLLTALVLTGAFVLSAQDYESLIFNLSDGSAVVLPAQGLRLEVKDAAMQATAADGTTSTIPFDRLASFCFSTDFSILPLAPGLLGDGGFDAYTLSGVSMGHFSSADALPAGTYIVVSEGRTLKIAVK